VKADNFSLSQLFFTVGKQPLYCFTSQEMFAMLLVSELPSESRLISESSVASLEGGH
jgi:hypothetical protein